MKQALNIPSETLAEQARASDPRNSVWVSANAGSGKTHVLVQRVVRLLLEGTNPSKILCLTYTRAAAANMANRIFKNLADWAMLDEQVLARQIETIEGRPPTKAKLSRARKLFATALETPGGLKIQTIHAFCEALLHQFPLEANIAGHFEMLDTQMEQALVGEARRDMITGAGAATNPVLAEAFASVLAAGGEFGLDALLDEIVRKRDPLRRFIDGVGQGSPRFSDLRAEFGFAVTDTPKSIAASLWPDRYFTGALAAEYLRRAQEAGKADAQKFANGLIGASGAADPIMQIIKLRDTFLTKKSSAVWPTRSLRNIAAKNVSNHFPGFEQEFERMAAAVRQAADRCALLGMIEATSAALTVAAWLIARYERLKAARGFLDFNDLITRTVKLLARQDAGSWVHYKLDKGIDHILVDEAQDTSPDQWQVVRNLASEFFSGQGARDNVHRTVFAVGDEKQSIYSFQGANPASFAESGTEFLTRVRAANGTFESVQLGWSFRSTEDVLRAVDLVFANEATRVGLTTTPDLKLADHRPIRTSQPGRVEVWPALGAISVEEPDDWAKAIDHTRAPAVQVAENIASTIDGWLRDREIIEGKNRRLNAGDILVLVRKRDRFVHALSRSLKNRGVAVAGADRLSLPAHIAVKDLAALGRFLLQRDDDLSLASVLKSPIFGESEERLFELAHGRPATLSLYASLRLKAGNDLFLSDIVAKLETWAAEAATKPVFEFYSGVLGRDRVRSAIIGRLGQEAGEVLDEFLNFALAEERTGLPGLEAFLATLESAAPEIKREMDQTRNEVRIMTVHAAKGLEAPVVFLVDSGGEPFSEQHLPRLIPFEPKSGLWQGPGFLWRLGADVANTVAREIGLGARELAEQEYRRLLYVGMTRAEDRLIVCGYYNSRTPTGATWHSLVSATLCSDKASRTVQNPYTSEMVCRFQVSPIRDPAPAEDEDKTTRGARSHLPALLTAQAVPEQRLPRPLSPSGASILISEDEDVVASTRSPVLDPDVEPSFAIQRGIAIHRLIQMLPGLERSERPTAMQRYLERAGIRWSQDERANVALAVERILGDAQFSSLFDLSESHAEVPLMGTLVVRGKERVISGKIDRMAVTDDQVMIVDYKTNRPPARTLAEVPEAYVVQMALYRKLLRQLYPGRIVAAALLFTETPQLIALDGAAMDAALARLAEP
ncbi:double-strand break repair helicase AddA [Mesorhizobium sp. NBSH29]|uniref:double-strand break repair helicase AddA n=1 Tax=Mesorhizobium sp. NBSH29 TaxID=2654249 RepID=UPI0018969455|nr:double-strand break repair helicase AddA [Mesorhizobium sp. NBSH29]QPC86106.1 double-strand break repair helicase AddA [Mesorhizobium sp. NBSH29]